MGSGKKRKRQSIAGDEHNGQDPLWDQAITHPSQMPKAMLKYWRNRHTLFSLFSSGILLDKQSWYSVTPEPIAARIAKRCACTTVLDVFCGAGGNAIQLAMTCEKVIAIDIDPLKIQLAKNNAAIYEVQDRITFLIGDSIEFLQDVDNGEVEGEKWQGAHREKIHVVFLSPPWGGVSYSDPASLAPTPNASPVKETAQKQEAYTDVYKLDLLTPLPGKDLFDLCRKITPDIAFYLPRNTDLYQIASLADNVSLEEQRLGTKLSAITTYYGKLASDWDDETDSWRQKQ